MLRTPDLHQHHLSNINTNINCCKSPVGLIVVILLSALTFKILFDYAGTLQKSSIFSAQFCFQFFLYLKRDYFTKHPYLAFYKIETKFNPNLNLYCKINPKHNSDSSLNAISIPKKENQKTQIDISYFCFTPLYLKIFGEIVTTIF